MKIDKVIMSCDNSHYKHYWPVVAKVCRKAIKATPVLFLIDEEETDIYFDGNGLVKKVKALPDISTGIQSLFYRIYGTKLFPDDVCLISDIDMMLLSEEYFQGSIKDFEEDSFVVYCSDAYDIERNDSKNLFSSNVFAMCYNAAKGRIFEEILDLSGDFSEFIQRINNHTIERKIEWYGDEVYLTNRVNLFSDKYKIHKLTRGYEEGFKVKDRIEKWQFPVEFTIPEMIVQNIQDGCYDKNLLSDGYYKDCHCVRPYRWYKEEIHKVANIVCNNHKLFQTIKGEDYSTVDDRCLSHEGDIVDIGCLHWDWSNFFIGKKRVIGVDPFESAIKGTESFKGVIGNFNGTTLMKNEGISSSTITSTINQTDGEIVEVNTWKKFCTDFNINSISVLKINIEGAEYDLLESFDDGDFAKIDQIAVSFHDWMVPEWKEKTQKSINLLRSKGFEIQKINETWGWFLLKKKLNNTLIQMNIENFEWGIMESYDLKDLLVRELFEDKIYNTHFDISEGDIVVDVGASVGPFIYNILERKPKHVYAIEPSKTEFPSLVRNTIGHPVTHYNKAIWEGDGITNQIDVYYADGYIEMSKFSTFRKLYGIEKINFLKTDCEGGEYHIFNEENIDFLVNNVDVIVGEWHLETPERKESFRRFRDHYLPRFKDVHVYSVDGTNIKWDLYNEHFIQFYKQVIIHIDNRKDLTVDI